MNVAYKNYDDLAEARQMDLVPNVQLGFNEAISVFAQLAYQYCEASLRTYKHGLRADVGLAYKMGAHW